MANKLTDSELQELGRAFSKTWQYIYPDVEFGPGFRETNKNVFWLCLDYIDMYAPEGRKLFDEVKARVGLDSLMKQLIKSRSLV